MYKYVWLSVCLYLSISHKTHRYKYMQSHILYTHKHIWPFNLYYLFIIISFYLPLSCGQQQEQMCWSDLEYLKVLQGGKTDNKRGAGISRKILSVFASESLFLKISLVT